MSYTRSNKELVIYLVVIFLLVSALNIGICLYNGYTINQIIGICKKLDVKMKNNNNNKEEDQKIDRPVEKIIINQRGNPHLQRRRNEALERNRKEVGNKNDCKDEKNVNNENVIAENEACENKR
ncbi:hypothetical protein SLOPH_498 [Spraguea lophii 42_110]|uniref:Uncharacterized protein n=1 Tax=Spraguea lophii (strain 42_110) TaxID=1358809 RepID=S7W621_SPRLO|nr:hypothetical protein SLOPH_498 [Spraguea lophii 42_110]